MAALLVSLTVEDEIIRTRQSGDQTPESTRISERVLRAHLILTPDGNPEAQKLGRHVDLRIECQPTEVQDLGPHKMVEWLANTLKQML
jgi:hypothetical protein